MAKNNTYDSSWDEDNDELWDQKYEEWKNRDWNVWLSENLGFFGNLWALIVFKNINLFEAGHFLCPNKFGHNSVSL